MTNKILFALTSHNQKGNTGQPTGFYLPEAAHPWAVLKSAGFEINFVSPKGGKPPMDGVDLNDAVSRDFLQDPEVDRKVANTAKPKDLDFRDYAAIFFVGGHGAMWDFPNDSHLANLAMAIYENGGIVSAVCHGPAALVNLKLHNGQYLVAGKRLAAFTDDEERAVNLDKVVPFLLATSLHQRGAHHISASNWQANVIVDGRLVTGQNPASAEGVGKEIVRLLKDESV
jgi:putative intracellular protease/amidase